MTQRLEFLGARLLFTLPPSIQLRLSGRPPVVIDGRTLHPQMQLLLALRDRWRGPSQTDQPLDEGREEFRRDAITIAGRPIAVGEITDRMIDGSAGPIPARHYASATGSARPLLVYYHGGGFVQGDVDTHDSVCRRICRRADVHVLSVDYRLAPEHPFPAAVHDAFAAFRWAGVHAAALGAMPDRVAVGGDSAGANLAAVVSLKARADGGPKPCAQVLLYPVTDRTRDRASMTLFAEGFFPTRSDIDRYQLLYTGSPAPQRNPEQYPLLADDLSGLPPALIVTAGFDPLRDEGDDYAAALRQAGVPVTLRRFDGLLHGFCSMATISPVCATAFREVCADIAALVGTMSGRPREGRDPDESRSPLARG